MCRLVLGRPVCSRRFQYGRLKIEDEVRLKAAGKLAEFGIELLGKCERERDPNQFKKAQPSVSVTSEC